MILGYYIIDPHAEERYRERVGVYSKMNTRQCIKADLHFSKIKKIVHKDDGTIHVFARHSVEFVFIKPKKTLILKTVIKRTRDKQNHAINKRQKQCKKAM
jgi:hypothetical protein